MAAPVDSNANPSDWQPDQSALDQLGDYVDFEGYQIRVPRGFTPLPATEQPGAKTTGWAGPAREDGFRQSLRLAMIPLSERELHSTVPQVLDTFLAGTKTHYENWQATTVEAGKINGRVFYRVECRGLVKDGPKVEVHLLNYAARDGNDIVYLLIIDNESILSNPSSPSGVAALTLEKK
jgi:hypothetical protein